VNVRPWSQTCNLREGTALMFHRLNHPTTRAGSTSYTCTRVKTNDTASSAELKPVSRLPPVVTFSSLSRPCVFKQDHAVCNLDSLFLAAAPPASAKVARLSLHNFGPSVRKQKTRRGIFLCRTTEQTSDCSKPRKDFAWTRAPTSISHSGA
jgi:hypothetical protein